MLSTLNLVLKLMMRTLKRWMDTTGEPRRAATVRVHLDVTERACFMDLDPYGDAAVTQSPNAPTHLQTSKPLLHPEGIMGRVGRRMKSISSGGKFQFLSLNISSYVSRSYPLTAVGKWKEKRKNKRGTWKRKAIMHRVSHTELQVRLAFGGVQLLQGFSRISP